MLTKSAHTLNSPGQSGSISQCHTPLPQVISYEGFKGICYCSLATGPDCASFTSMNPRASTHIYSCPSANSGRARQLAEDSSSPLEGFERRRLNHLATSHVGGDPEQKELMLSCGDGTCGANENWFNCVVDCEPSCGNGVCECTEDGQWGGTVRSRPTLLSMYHR
jgi:hypothetical protein